jgi:hypothetical protein
MFGTREHWEMGFRNATSEALRLSLINTAADTLVSCKKNTSPPRSLRANTLLVGLHWMPKLSDPLGGIQLS